MILAIDLGITTGWVLFNHGGLVNSGCIVRANAEHEFYALLDRFVNLSGPRYVVVEMPLLNFTSALGDSLRQLSYELTAAHSKADPNGWYIKEWLNIGPSQWKNDKVFRLAESYDTTGMVVHEKDALGIAVWFYYKHYSKEKSR